MRWLARNFDYRLRRALRHPRYTLQALFRDLLGVDERFLARVCGSTPGAIRGYLNEPFSQSEFVRYVRECSLFLRAAPHPANDFYAKKVLLQYAVARALAPEIIVETGVASGISSNYLLMACKLNGKGHLYSIDINSREFLPKGTPTGWIVPRELRTNWTLLLGNAKTLLPELLRKLGGIDVFIHDSEHTYDHMKFELETAYPYIRRGGLLLSDDSNFNAAFEECVQSFRPAAARVIRNIGMMKKL